VVIAGLLQRPFNTELIDPCRVRREE